MDVSILYRSAGMSPELAYASTGLASATLTAPQVYGHDAWGRAVASLVPIGQSGGGGGPTHARHIYTHAEVEKMRLDALHEQDSHYGRGIPQVYGKFKLSGNVIWAGDPYVAPQNSFLPPPFIQPAPGDPIPAGDVWRQDIAILICRGPIHRVNCIWADDVVIYADESLINSGDATLGTGFNYYNLAVYPGSESQDPDPTMEDHLGSGNVPAYRGSCLAVITGLDISTRFGNKLPTFAFAVQSAGRGGVSVSSILTDVATQCGLTGSDYDFSAATAFT